MVTGIAVTTDSEYIMAGTKDGLLNLYRVRDLVPHLQYSFELRSLKDGSETRINSLIFLHDTHVLCVGLDNGEIHLYSPPSSLGSIFSQVTSEKNELTLIDEVHVGSPVIAMLDFISPFSQSHILAYVTADCRLNFHDLRARSDVFSYDLGKEKGRPTCISHGLHQTNTLLIGTSGGRIIVFDIRL